MPTASTGSPSTRMIIRAGTPSSITRSRQRWPEYLVVEVARRSTVQRIAVVEHRPLDAELEPG